MTNHVHLATQVAEISISRIMHNLCSRYSKQFNRRYDQSGHLFGGRFRAFRINTDARAKELIRYIHLNPFRAGLTEPLGPYSWSSQHAYLHGGGPDWLETDWVTGLFGSDTGSARRNIKEFVLEGAAEAEGQEADQDPEQSNTEAQAEWPLASPASPIWKAASLDQLIDQVLAGNLDESLLGSRSLARPLVEARGIAAWLVRECQSPSLTDLASRLRRDPSALSHAASRLDLRQRREPDLRRRLLEITEALADSVVRDRCKPARSDS